MSTLNVSNITDGTDTVGTSYVVNGSAKAWCNIDAAIGTPSFADSMNFSSVTDVGTGNFDPDFTTAMASSNFAVSSGSNAYGLGNDHMTATVRASTGITINCSYLWSGARDRPNNCAIVMGDLA